MPYLKNEEKETLIKCKRVFDSIRVFEPADKNTIVANTKLAWNTVGVYLDELSDIKAIYSDSNNYYHIKNDFGYFVGISLGVTEIKISIIGMSFDYDKTTVSWISSLCDYLNNNSLKPDGFNAIIGDNGNYICIPSPEDYIEAYTICSSIFEGIISSNNKKILSVGMCVPGIINKITHVVDFSPNIPWLANRNAYDLIRKSLISELEEMGVRFWIYHDMDCVTVYELEKIYKNEKDIKNKDIMCLYMSYGIGSTLVKNNGLRLFSSSEHGHIMTSIDSMEKTKNLKKNDPLFSICACGQDCLENQLRREVFHSSDFRSFQLATTDEKLGKLSHESIATFSKYIGFLLNHIINTMRVSYIVMSGRLLVLTKSIALDMDRIRVSYSIPALSNNCSIILGSSNLDIAAIGSAMIAYHSFTSKERLEDLIISW